MSTITRLYELKTSIDEVLSQLKDLQGNFEFDQKNMIVYFSTDEEVNLFGWNSFVDSSKYKYQYYKEL